MIKEAALDLAALRAQAQEARERIQRLPEWQQEAIRLISYSATSWEARQVLFLESELLESREGSET